MSDAVDTGPSYQGPAPPCSEVAAPDFGWRDALEAGPPTSALAAALDSLTEGLSNGASACRAEFAQLEELQSRLAVHESFTAAQRASLSNRYSDVLPYDSNRVRVTPPARAASRFGTSRARSDYINASPLVNPQPDAAVPWRYIAAQGPLPRTCPAFWQMIVEAGVRVVVMLTRVTERGGAKCAPYFADYAGGEVGWGDTRVLTQGVEELVPHLFRRRLAVTLPCAAAPHHVVQLHYTDWPDHGVPSNPRALLTLCALLRCAAPDFSSPVLVHCSAGIGRSGVLCVLDIAIRQLCAAADPGAARSAVRLGPVVESLRRQRGGMVQTPEQYVLCYLALLQFVDAAIRARGQEAGLDGQLQRSRELLLAGIAQPTALRRGARPHGVWPHSAPAPKH